MFKAEEIAERLNAKNFAPFRIHLSDGESFDVLSHDHAMVSKNSVEIGLNTDNNRVAERFVKCALMHITRIEELQAA